MWQSGVTSKITFILCFTFKKQFTQTICKYLVTAPSKMDSKRVYKYRMTYLNIYTAFSNALLNLNQRKQ